MGIRHRILLFFSLSHTVLLFSHLQRYRFLPWNLHAIDRATLHALRKFSILKTKRKFQYKSLSSFIYKRCWWLLLLTICVCVWLVVSSSLWCHPVKRKMYIYIIDPPLKVIKIHVMYSCCRLTFSPCEEHWWDLPVLVTLLHRSVWNFSKMKRGRCMFFATWTGSVFFHTNTKSSVVHPSILLNVKKGY